MKKVMIMVSMALALGFLLSGCATQFAQKARFVDLGNGVCQDTVSGTMWEMKKSRLIRSLEEARRYAAELRIGGYDDWRLPSSDELFDLNYLFDLHQGGDCTIEREGNFWSDQKDGEGLVGAWEIADQCDPERQYFPASKGYVRAVRP